jgi:hypothetical protein
MRLSLPAAALALPALAVSLAAVAAPADGGAAAPPTRAKVENTTAAASLIVVRDPVTGKLRAPTPEEVQKLMASGRHTTVKSEPRDVRSPTGAEGVALGDSMLHDEAVRKNARGVVEHAHDREASHD